MIKNYAMQWIVSLVDIANDAMCPSFDRLEETPVDFKCLYSFV